VQLNRVQLNRVQLNRVQLTVRLTGRAEPGELNRAS